MFSLLAVACKKDNDDTDSSDLSQKYGDPTVSIIISGEITDTVSFTLPGGVMTDHSISASYVGVADLLSLHIVELPTGFQFSFFGNRDYFATGDYEASGVSGYGAYNDPNADRTFIATSTTITISSMDLIQNIVQASYNANGSFSSTLEDPDDATKVIQIEGKFENITLSVNE